MTSRMGWQLVLVGGMAAAPAHAAEVDATAAFERARQAFEELDYDVVAPNLERALAAGTLSKVQTLLAFDLLARVHVMYGRTDEAVDAFGAALRIDRSYRPTDRAPKVQRAFGKARARFDAGTSTAPSAAPAPTSGPPPTTPALTSVPPPATPAVTSVPPPAALEIAPPSGREQSPRAQRPGSVFRRWWFWASVAAGAALVGGGALWWGTQARNEPPQADFGPYDL